MLRWLLVGVALLAMASCPVARQKHPLCGPDHPEWLEPLCRIWT